MQNKIKEKSGFTLVEILIVVVILGVLAAIVIPQFSNAGIDAKTSALCTNLRKVRLQIILYKAHHGGGLPTLANFTEQMTGTTNINGNPSGSDTGPYLRSIPLEPFSSNSTVTANGTTGWNYDEASGDFWAPYDSNL